MDNFRTAFACLEPFAEPRRAAFRHRLMARAAIDLAAPQAHRTFGWQEPTTEASIQILDIIRTAAQASDLHRSGTALPRSDDRRGVAQ